MTNLIRICCALIFITVAGASCALGGPEIDEVGEVCVSDLDCPEELECVLADSPNASRACMPRP